MPVEIVMETDLWDELVLDAQAHAALAAVSAAHGGALAQAEVALLACDDARISELNADFRGKPVPTNVLSWPSEERANPDGIPRLPELGRDPELGDIAIAYETCVREAAQQGKPFQDHVTHLLVHGLLHLLGYDHERQEDAAIMEKLEVEILANLGIADPY